MSAMHQQNLDEPEYDECDYCIQPWPCPGAVRETEAARASVQQPEGSRS